MSKEDAVQVEKDDEEDRLVESHHVVALTSQQRGALSLVQIVESLCSNWWNLTGLAPWSMP